MIWGLDTETDHDGQKAWIVQWVVTGRYGTFKGTCSRTLTHCLRKLGRTREKQYIYIHNLAYDLEFIKYCIWDLIHEFGGRINPIFRNGKPIQIALDVNGRTLIFRDSAKKWQGNLRSLGDALNYPKLENIDPEFHPGWSDLLDLETEEAWRYVIRDAKICAKAGEFWHSQGFNRATTSGDAWHDMRAMKGTKMWNNYFPPLTREEDDKLRDGYFGGINISRRNGYHQGPITHEDRVSMYPAVMLNRPLPVGSPIYTGHQFPDTELWVGRMTVKLDLKEGHIAWFTFKNGIDYCGENIDYGQHIEHCNEWHTLTLTNVDWDNLAIDYDITVMKGPAEFWTFASATGILKEYIDKWAAEKKAAPKGSAAREHAKRMLNASYGRFALIPDGEVTELIEEDGNLRWRCETVAGEPSAYLPYALFVTAWARRELMDRVRKVQEIRGADSILHCDTDSVIYIGEPIGGYGKEIGDWDLESQPIGIYEGGFKRYIEFLPGPMYQEKNGKIKITGINLTCAGVPQPKRADGLPYGMQIELIDRPFRILGGELGHEHYKIECEWLRDLYKKHGKDPDDVNTLKLLPRRVPGGVILEGHTHEIDDGLHIRLNRSI